MAAHDGNCSRRPMAAVARDGPWRHALPGSRSGRKLSAAGRVTSSWPGNSCSESPEVKTSCGKKKEMSMQRDRPFLDTAHWAYYLKQARTNRLRESESTLCIEFGTSWDERITRVFLISLSWTSEENWAKLSHMCMGGNLSEPSAGCCSLVLSSGWGDRSCISRAACSSRVITRAAHAIPHDPKLKSCAVQHGKRSFRPQRN